MILDFSSVFRKEWSNVFDILLNKIKQREDIIRNNILRKRAQTDLIKDCIKPHQ